VFISAKVDDVAIEDISSVSGGCRRQLCLISTLVIAAAHASLFCLDCLLFFFVC